MTSDLQIVGFRIGKEMFGVSIALVHEIVRVPEVTAVPEAPEYVEGVINLRGRIVPVVDLRKRFAEQHITSDRKNRILVTEVDKRTVGVIVDATSEVLKLKAEQVEPPPTDLIQAGETTYITGIARVKDRLIILVDLKKILTTSGLGHLSMTGELAPATATLAV
ncbi:MAG: chemotaxis protein CheW [Terriglobales bacterium]